MAGFMEIGGGNLYHGNFMGTLMGSSGSLMGFCIPENKALVFSLGLTASLHLKMDGWNTNLFLLGQKAYFSGTFAVSFRECNKIELYNK